MSEEQRLLAQRDRLVQSLYELRQEAPDPKTDPVSYQLFLATEADVLQQIKELEDRLPVELSRHWPSYIDDQEGDQ